MNSKERLLSKQVRNLKNTATMWWLSIWTYTKNWPIKNALNTIKNVNKYKNWIKDRTLYQEVLDGKTESLLTISRILDEWKNNEDIQYKWFRDPLQENPTIIFREWWWTPTKENSRAFHLPDDERTHDSIIKDYNSEWKLSRSPLRRRRR